MKISLLVIGKTDAGYFSQGIQEYENRLKHYLPFEMQVIPDIKNVKNLSEEQQKESLFSKICWQETIWYCSTKEAKTFRLCNLHPISKKRHTP